MHDALSVELDEVLERVGAPGALVREVRERALDFAQAWDECADVTHRLWLAACGGAPVEVVVESACAVVLRVTERLGRRADFVAEAAERAARGDVTELSPALEACETWVEAAPATYRDPASASLWHAAKAASLVGHAALGLAEGEARREAPRLEQARRTAALLGAGSHITLPARAGPARLEPLAAPDPAQSSFAYAVAAAAEALVECVAALRALEQGGAIEAEVDALVRGTLEE